MSLLTHGVRDGLARAGHEGDLESQSPTTLPKLTRAAYVEFSVGKTPSCLRDKNVAALRDMNNRVKSAGTGRRPARACGTRAIRTR